MKFAGHLRKASPVPQPAPKAEPRWFLSEGVPGWGSLLGPSWSRGAEEPSVDYFGEDSDPDDEALQAAHQLRSLAGEFWTRQAVPPTTYADPL